MILHPHLTSPVKGEEFESFHQQFFNPCIPHSWGDFEIGGHPRIPRQRGSAPLDSPFVNDLRNLRWLIRVDSCVCYYGVTARCWFW